MKRANVINLTEYREDSDSLPIVPRPSGCSEELANAIQNLIQRLRDSNPIKEEHAIG